MDISMQHYEEANKKVNDVYREVSSFIVGQEQAKKQVFWSMLAGGHVLLEGLPGVGKTMLIRTFADVLSLTFSRIQFTPDLMPSDITGTMMINQHDKEQRFQFHEGPIFSQIVLADEINRATPKTQSALLEAMAEKTVTVMGETKSLPKPFFVLATQNPVELEGTYPLPEAQTDRFLCKVTMEYPTKEELKTIIERTVNQTEVTLQEVLDQETLQNLQQLVQQILLSDEVLDYAIELIEKTQPTSAAASEQVKRFVRYGAGPRGLQSLIRLAKARALTEGRLHVSIGDIKEVFIPVLRHRLFLTFEGEAQGFSSDTILAQILGENSEVSRSI
ncbi:AAA family ATPase [Alkalihalobacillus pseudalcaliphilus]|uniref:AAA family ATPase n=1 Tax=Alkalihalobacillus pseudalcaliphilus TaxID=79884 RepID=UPI00064DFF93|nr:AAA family ATPase [Alkalihalobacillus pseudalcaliphilus]KMK76369.1 ATPase AAA [Alkalihalobacillus pseudalcaliphilus]